MKLTSSDEIEAGGTHAVPSVFDRVVSYVAWLAAAIGAGVVLLMMLVVAYAVVNRYILGTPITWTDEFSGYLVVALVMLGAADTLRRGDHIAVDLITARLSPRARRLAAIWGHVMVLVFAAALLYSAKTTLEYSINFGILSEGYLEAPMWIPQSFLVVGGVLMALVSVASLIRLIKRDPSL